MPIKCISLDNQPCQTRPAIADINSNEFFYPFDNSVNKCGRSFNTFDNPYVQVCVPNKARNMNVKVFNLISRVNKTRYLVQNESCQCECGLNERAFNSNQK